MKKKKKRKEKEQPTPWRILSQTLQGFPDLKTPAQFFPLEEDCDENRGSAFYP